MVKSPIVARINSLLAEKGISKTDFYRDCGITSATYSMWNTGKTQPRKKNIQTIAEYLGVTVSDLLPEIKKDPSLSTEALDPAVIQLMEEVKTLPPELLDLVANYVRDAKKIYRGTK